LSVHSMRTSPLFRPVVRLALVALAATTLSAVAGQTPAAAAAGCVSTADCLSKMTLAEKAGQMTQVANTYIKTKTDISTYALGSVLSGGGGGPQAPHR
jgi:beta-glucosidase